MYSNMDEDDVEVSAGFQLYDIFGNEIPVFQADDGRAFVAVDDLKRHKFPLFTEECLPHRITDEDFLKQLKMYITVKARKFLILHKPYTLKANDVNSLITEVIDEHTSGKPLPMTPKSSQGPRRSYNSTPSSINDNHRKSDPNRNSVNHNNRYGGNKPWHKSQMNGTPPYARENSSPNTTRSPQGSPHGSTGSAASFKSSAIPEFNPVSIPLNSPLEVSVTCVLNARRCYVHVKAREQHLLGLLCRVQTEAVKAVRVSPEIGKIYAALYEGDWYRAKVLSVNPLRAHYIDFGNENEEPLTEVRLLSKDLRTEPMEGICINFGNNAIDVPLVYGTVLNIVALRQNGDKSYHVKKALERNGDCLRRPEVPQRKRSVPEVNNAQKAEATTHCTKTPRANFTANMPNDAPTPEVSINKLENKKIEATTTAKSSENSTQNATHPPDEKLNVTQNATHPPDEKLNVPQRKNVNPPKNTIMDVYTKGVGIVQYLNTIKDELICFVLPESSVDVELNRIEQITSETLTNKNYKATTGDCVAVFKEDEEKWVRATVINKRNASYTVALIDYGAVETTDAIRELPKDIAEIPEFCCICTGSARFINEVKEDTLSFEILKKNKFKVTYSDGTAEDVVCIRWDPFTVNNVEVKTEDEEEKSDLVFIARPKQKVLSSDDIVVISNFNDGKLLVRTKECYTAYNQLKDSILKYTASPLKQPPQANQIVLCPYENSKELHRAIVSAINGNSAEIEYIDLGFSDSISTASLSSISKPLATNDFTLIAIALNRFETDDYNDDVILELQKCCDSRTKFVAKNVSDGVYDLFSSTNDSLSEMLKQCCKKDSVFLYENLPKQTTASGSISVICISNEQIDDKIACFFPKDELTLNNFQLITDAAGNVENDDQHVPVVNEVCFAFFDGEWYRARVLTADTDSDQFKMAYIDYGNEAVVPSSKIRKLNKDLMKIAPIAMNCKVNDFNGSEITAGQEYQIQILKFENSFYSVDIIQ